MLYCYSHSIPFLNKYIKLRTRKAFLFDIIQFFPKDFLPCMRSGQLRQFVPLPLHCRQRKSVLEWWQKISFMTAYSFWLDTIFVVLCCNVSVQVISLVYFASNFNCSACPCCWFCPCCIICRMFLQSHTIKFTLKLTEVSLYFCDC